MPSNTSFERTRARSSAKLMPRQPRRSTQPLERMRRSRKITSLLPVLAFCLAMAVAYSHSIPDPDKVFTLELPEPNVEQLVRRVETVLVARDFTKLHEMSRRQLDMSELPASASFNEGIILARFERKGSVTLSVHVTACRVEVLMWLPSGADKAAGGREMQSVQLILVSGLSNDKKLQVTLADGLGGRNDPCVVPVRSNKSLERTRDR